MLKRSRGGALLDPYEIYHLIALCHQHHRYAETSGDETGLLIDGYVITDSITGRPVYTGSDPYLSATYGPEAPVSVVPESVRYGLGGPGPREEV
jgi:hypothetical protein